MFLSQVFFAQGCGDSDPCAVFGLNHLEPAFFPHPCAETPTRAETPIRAETPTRAETRILTVLWSPVTATLVTGGTQSFGPPGTLVTGGTQSFQAPGTLWTGGTQYMAPQVAWGLVGLRPLSPLLICTLWTCGTQPFRPRGNPGIARHERTCLSRDIYQVHTLCVYMPGGLQPEV